MQNKDKINVINEKIKFQDIYKTYYKKIHRYISKIIGYNEADDLTQEVFIKINKSLHTFRSESQISIWIYKIATNLALDRLRSSYNKNAKKTDFIDDLEQAIIDKYIISNHKQIDEEIVKKEMNECIKNFIKKLPKSYKTVLVLSEFEALKNKKIANILNISVDTVKIRLHRAKSKLKEILSQNCEFYYDSDNILCCDLKNSSCSNV